MLHVWTPEHQLCQGQVSYLVFSTEGTTQLLFVHLAQVNDVNDTICTWNSRMISKFDTCIKNKPVIIILNKINRVVLVVTQCYN